MNKDFEKAYKELADIEVPDLWDRIEAGLTEKSAPYEESVSIEKSQLKENRKKPAVISYVKRYSALAAAILCAVIILPVLGVMRQAGNSKNSSESAELTEDAYALEEECTEGEETAAENTVVTVGVGAAETAESMEADEMEDFASNDIMKEDAMKESAAAMAEEKSREPSEEAGLAEGRELTNVIVEITEVKNFISEAQTADEMGTLYTAVVREDPSGVLTEGEQIVIFIPVYSSFGLCRDEIFELDIEYCEKENYSFIVKGYYEFTEQ